MEPKGRQLKWCGPLYINSLYNCSIPTFQIATTVEELLVRLKLCSADLPIEALLISKAKLLHSTFLVIEKMLIKKLPGSWN